MYLLPNECKVGFLSVLNRVQAFEICGRGDGHSEFVSTLLDKTKQLYACAADGEVSVIDACINNLNVMLDEKFETYDAQVKLNIIELIKCMQPDNNVEYQIQQLSELVSIKFEDLKNMSDKINKLSIDVSALKPSKQRKFVDSEGPEYLRVIEFVKQRGSVSISDTAKFCSVSESSIFKIRRWAQENGYKICLEKGILSWVN